MRRGLPKKYAKMGFKKGWREYKKSLRSRSSSRAPKRRAPKRRFATTRSSSSKRKPKMAKNGRLTKMQEDLAMTIGGSGSEVVSRLVSSVTSSFGLNVSDDVAGTVGSHFAEQATTRYFKAGFRGAKIASASRAIGGLLQGATGLVSGMTNDNSQQSSTTGANF